MPSLIDVYPELPSDQYYASYWKEMIENAQPGGGETFSLQSGEATIAVKVGWAKARSFTRFALGFSYADTGSPWKLRRENPIAHPRFPWLTASTVSFGAQAPVANDDKTGTYVPGIYADSLRAAQYDHEVATVRFVDYPWLFLPDADIDGPEDEATRNTYWDPVPSIEMISAEGINNVRFKYTGSPAPAANAAVPAPFGTLMAKVTYTLNWMWVPQEYISDEDFGAFYPRRILNCVGRVNSEEFMGFEANTLLLQPPAFQRFRFPIAGATAATGGFFGWNIRLPMQYFKPDAGTQSGVPPGMVFAGHQLLPWRKNLKWYPAVRVDDAANESKLFPEADFNDIFKHILAP